MSMKTFVTGPFQVNTYVLINEISKEAVAIDIGGSVSEIAKYLNEEGATLKFIINTHGHFDHILGEKEARQRLGVPLYMSKLDEPLVKNLSKTLSLFGIPVVEPPGIDGFIDEQSDLSLGSTAIRVLHTPGHTPGGLCFLLGDRLFSGDTLFQGSIGRTDLEGGDSKQLKDSIKQKLLVLDDAITVYPGHGASTTIGYERLHNPFLS